MMKQLIDQSQKHLLWKDECGEDFLLLPWCEIFLYSDDIVGLYAFSYKKLALLREMEVITDEWETDDEFYTIYAKTSDLSRIIELGTFCRRPNLDGNWMRKTKERLGHDIIPYTPAEFSEKTQPQPLQLSQKRKTGMGVVANHSEKEKRA